MVTAYRPHEGSNTEYYANKQKRLEYTIKEGKLEGNVVMYCMNGKKMRTATFVSGKARGSVQEFSCTDGNVLNEYEWENGHFVGIQRIYYEGTKIVYRETDFDSQGNIRHMITFFGDGSISHEENYVAGKLDGLATIFYPNGAIRVKQQYNKGVPDGLTEEYDENGMIIKTLQYDKGRVSVPPTP